MPHVEQQSHGCTTLASKHANHLTTSKVRAPLLPVHTTLYDARTNDRETQCDRKRRTGWPLNFKHAQKSDATAGERKNRMQRNRQLVQRWRAIVRMLKSRIAKCFKVVVRQL